jgi:hypothetical protein
VSTIKKNQQEKSTSPPRPKSYENSLPSNTMKDELRRRRKEDPNSLVSEWEKGRLKKLFKAYDRDKKACIKLDDVRLLYADLVADRANLGKVPHMNLEDFIRVMNMDTAETLTWDNFCFNLNQVGFMRAPDELLLKKIDDKYYDFNKKINTGKRDEGREFLYDGIRMENARDMEETQK